MTARRLLRTESEQRLMQPDLLGGTGRYYSLRPSAGSMHRQMHPQHPGGILRRRSLMESCSDTEVRAAQSPGRRPSFPLPTLSPYTLFTNKSAFAHSMCGHCAYAETRTKLIVYARTNSCDAAAAP